MAQVAVATGPVWSIRAAVADAKASSLDVMVAALGLATGRPLAPEPVHRSGRHIGLT